MSKQLRWLLILATGVILVLVGVYGYDAFLRHDKAIVSFRSVPDDLSINIDNHIYKHPSTLYLTPGTYSLIAKKDGFADRQLDITVKKGENPTVLVPLEAVSDDAKAWAEKNQEKYWEIEGLAEEQSSGDNLALINKYPLLKKLPYDNYLFSITYHIEDYGDEKRMVIDIRSPDIYREAALQQLRNLGVDPVDYTINFSDYRNPFTS